jgi:uncharacterized NAD(P)/FAD-binding protein YdhS
MVDPQTSRRDGTTIAAMWEETAKSMTEAGVEHRFVSEAQSLAKDVAWRSTDQALHSEPSVLKRMDFRRHLKDAERAKSPYAMRQAIDVINDTFNKLEKSLATGEQSKFREHRASFNDILADRLADLQSQMDRSGLAVAPSGDTGKVEAADKSPELDRGNLVDVRKYENGSATALTVGKDNRKKAEPTKPSGSIKARRHCDRDNDRGR